MQQQGRKEIASVFLLCMYMGCVLDFIFVCYLMDASAESLKRVET